MVVFAHNNLDLNAFIVFVLSGIDMFLHRGAVIIDMFFNAVVDEACRAINVLLLHVSWYTAFLRKHNPV